MSDAATVRKQQFLNQLGTHQDHRREWLETLDPETRSRITQQQRATRHGLQALAPLTCQGPAGCPFIDACPIPKRTGTQVDLGPVENYPLGSGCVLEYEYMCQQLADYVVHLDIDPANVIEMSIANELALIDLYKNRALLIVSHGDSTGSGRDFLLEDKVQTGISDNGTVLESVTRKLHPVVEYIDRLENRRSRWLDKLLQTRAAQLQIKLKTGAQQDRNKLLEQVQAIKDTVLGSGTEMALDDLLEIK